MANYILSNKAVDDLSNIWDYTFNVWSEPQAEKYYYMLLDICQDIGNGKLKGKPYPSVKKDLLGFHAGRHIIFYRNGKGNIIEVARILHSRMDLKKRIKE